jgi:hypothetical protein
LADLRIAWVQSDDDPTLDGDVVAYELARATSPNPVSVVATIAAGVDQDDTLHLETLPPGTYWYRVRAVDAAGNRSVWSDEASVTVLPGDGAVVTRRVDLIGLANLRHETDGRAGARVEVVGRRRLVVAVRGTA